MRVTPPEKDKANTNTGITLTPTRGSMLKAIITMTEMVMIRDDMEENQKKEENRYLERAREGEKKRTNDTNKTRQTKIPTPIRIMIPRVPARP